MSEIEMLEAEKYWCENCCNWDKEHVMMDGYAKCKLTGTLCFAQESGKECKCFNVPAENVVVPPCKVEDVVYKVVCANKGDCCGIADFNCEDCPYRHRYIAEGNVISIKYVKGIRLKVKFDKFTDYFCDDEVYFTKEEAEEALKGGVQG